MNDNLMDSKTYDENRDCITNLKLSTSIDCTDELTRSRDYFSQGDLIFIFKSSKDNTDINGNTLYEVCVRVHNSYTTSTEDLIACLDRFIVEIYTKDYSVIYPHVPRTYLDVELYDILKDFKVPNDILIMYKQIIEDLKV